MFYATEYILSINERALFMRFGFQDADGSMKSQMVIMDVAGVKDLYKRLEKIVKKWENKNGEITVDKWGPIKESKPKQDIVV